MASRAEFLLLAALAAWASTACAASRPAGQVEAPPPPPRLAAIETRRLLTLRPADSGIQLVAVVQLSLAPKDPLALEVVGLRPAGEPGDDAVVEVQLAWTDFEGLHPTSFGGSMRRVVPFGAGGPASRDEPLVVSLSFDLPPAEARVLARRVRAWARLHPVDMSAGALHTGGASVEFEATSALSFQEQPEGSLAEALVQEDGSPRALFLLAVGAGAAAATEDERLSALIEALPELTGARMEATFGALQCLTGETHGRSVYRWQSWWHRRQAGGEP